MLESGNGIIKNKEEAYKMMKNLSDHGVNRATDFLESYF